MDEAICIGDSHSLFTFASLREVTIYWLGAVTMHRVGRDGFRSLMTYRRGINPLAVRKLQTADCVLLSFGEIDCREHVRAIAEKQGETIEAVCEDLADRYFTAISEFFTGAGRRIVVAVPPATSHDDSSEQIHIRKTLNRVLEEGCAAAACEFFDYWPLCQSAPGVLDEAYGDGVHVAPRNNAFIGEQLKKAHGLDFTYDPGFVDIFDRPMSSRTLLGRTNRLRRRLKAGLFGKEATTQDILDGKA